MGATRFCNKLHQIRSNYNRLHLIFSVMRWYHVHLQHYISWFVVFIKMVHPFTFKTSAVLIAVYPGIFESLIASWSILIRNLILKPTLIIEIKFIWFVNENACIIPLERYKTCNNENDIDPCDIFLPINYHDTQFFLQPFRTHYWDKIVNVCKDVFVKSIVHWNATK